MLVPVPTRVNGHTSIRHPCPHDRAADSSTATIPPSVLGAPLTPTHPGAVLRRPAPMRSAPGPRGTLSYSGATESRDETPTEASTACFGGDDAWQRAAWFLSRTCTVKASRRQRPVR